ncbi:MAG: bifunctional 5,10-methylenetetrahydrofolate dehydrogenase/5,10-methenyltetrahydrofolate cyclohydrolase [Candidatus Omnitrophica bacterium]|nr:bifunctional 5,10-methylenetetrahydrofolate dehydrogenase/5,10-methenyltetrahydrofolate cyclohydrolase [Candidatus Omnitrophota bacterium]
MAELLDGKKLAVELKAQLKDEIRRIKSDFGKTPRVINIMVGNDPGSCAYAKSQMKVAEEIGVDYKLKNVSASISQEELTNLILKLNMDPDVNGIMLHKPVPMHIDYHVLANHVDTVKDLEGINVANIGKMILGETNIIPCTPASVMEHIKSTGMDLRGKEAVVVGHSGIVGKPLSLLLLEQYATVTVCHIATSEAGKLVDHVKRADILIVAVGKPGVIDGGWVKKNAVVIDVGINRVNGKIVGDVQFDEAMKRAAYITPVPGGVGPVTVVMLMRNAIEAFHLQKIKKKKVFL